MINQLQEEYPIENVNPLPDYKSMQLITSSIQSLNLIKCLQITEHSSLPSQMFMSPRHFKKLNLKFYGRRL